MKVIFLGTPEFAVPSLKAIVGAGHDVPLVITQPDRPKGRDGRPQPPPVKLAAQALNVPVLQTESVNTDDTWSILHKLRPDVIAVAAFGQILGRKVIEAARIACINVHASLLPKYRGAAPIPAAILNGDEVTGVTIQKMVRKVDAGDIIRQCSTPIGADETAGELTERLAHLGAGLLVEAMADLEAGRASFVVQDEREATCAPMLDKKDGQIKWTDRADRIARHVRAMMPWPGAYGFLCREKTPLRVTFGKAAANGPHDGLPGEVVAVKREYFAVKAAEGSVLVFRLQPAGKQMMTAAEFIRGYRLKTGDRFAEG